MENIILLIVALCGMVLVFVYAKTMTKAAQEAEERERKLFQKYLDDKSENKQILKER